MWSSGEETRQDPDLKADDSELLDIPGRLFGRTIKQAQEARSDNRVFPRPAHSAPKEATSWSYGDWYDGNYAQRHEMKQLASNMSQERKSADPPRTSPTECSSGRCKSCCCHVNKYPQWNLPKSITEDDRLSGTSIPTNAGRGGHGYSSRLQRSGRSLSAENYRLGSRCCCTCHYASMPAMPAYSGPASHGFNPYATAHCQGPQLSSVKTWLKGASREEAAAALELLRDKAMETPDRHYSNFFSRENEANRINAAPRSLVHNIRLQHTKAWNDHQLKMPEARRQLPDPKVTGTFLPPAPLHDKYLFRTGAEPNPVKAWYAGTGSGSKGRPGTRTLGSRAGSSRRYGLLGDHHQRYFVSDPANISSHFSLAQADHLKDTDFSIHPDWGLAKPRRPEAKPRYVPQ